MRLAHFVIVLQQSLCSEMAEELRFAVRCHGSRQRPALKRSCTRCSPGTTYVPAALEMPHINGVSEYLQRSIQPPTKKKIVTFFPLFYLQMRSNIYKVLTETYHLLLTAGWILCESQIHLIHIFLFQETGILPMVEMKKSSLSYDPDT